MLLRSRWGFRISALLSLLPALVGSMLVAQGNGGIGARARVLSAEPARAGIQAAVRVLDTWQPGLASERRAEAGLTTVMVQVESSAASVSIHFLRN